MKKLNIMDDYSANKYEELYLQFIFICMIMFQI